MAERSALAGARWQGDGLVLEERPGLGAISVRLKGEPSGGLPRRRWGWS